MYTLIAVCIGYLMVVIDMTIVNVALPSMSRELSGNISWLQWVIDGYTLTFACFMLPAGVLSDRLGAKHIYLSGLLLFVVASLACGLANDFLLLTLFRLVQGIGASLLVPTSIALIHGAYSDATERSRAFGTWGSIAGTGAAAGPVFGAFLTSWFSWRAVFFVNIPIGLLAFYLTYKLVKDVKNPHEEQFDLVGQIVGTISMAALAFALIEAGRIGWVAPLVLTSLGLFLLTFSIFLVIEYHTKTPIIPLSLFRSSTFSVCIFTGIVLNLCVYGILFLLPLYFQEVRHYTVLMTGLAVFPLMVLAPTSYFAGRLASVAGPKIPMLIGLLAAASGFLSVLLIKPDMPYIYLILPLALIGLGGSFTMPSATIAIMGASPQNKIGMASGAFNTSRQIGSLMGVALFGTIVTTAVHFMHGMNLTLLLSGLSFLLCALLVFWGVK